MVEFDKTRGELNTYVQDSESWLRDHHEAAACVRWENLMQRGNHLFELILDLDNTMQLEIIQNEDLADEWYQKMDILLRMWSETSKRVATSGLAYSEKGYHVANLGVFTKNLNEAHHMLAPLNFVDNRMAQKCEEALQQNRVGLCLEGLHD